MSNTAQTLTNIIKNISANQMQKTGYTTIVNAEVMTVVNPFTKEYKVKIDGIPVTAYGIYDVVYNVGDWVVVIESDVDNVKDRYIVAESSTAGSQSFNISDQDKYDQVGAPIRITIGQEEDIELPILPHPYCRISTKFTPSYTDQRFESKISIYFDDGDPIVYSSDLMEGALISGQQIEQLSPYFQIPYGATKIVSITQEDLTKYQDTNVSTWADVTLTFYNEAQDWEATALKLLAPTGYTAISGENANILEAKLRKNFIRINPDEVEYVWFRENPLIVEGDEKYDARAGAGWEKIILPVQAE